MSFDLVRRALRAGAPLVLVTTLFLAVLHARPTPMWRRAMPGEPYDAQHCTWYCHNHGCRHRPLLPAWLASDAGAFGRTMQALYAIGGRLSGDRGVGYGTANLVVFCVAWPVATYGLWLLMLHQRRALRERARAARRSS